MTNLADMRMNPLTLRFPIEFETKFLDDYNRRFVSQLRLTILLGIIIYAITGFLDPWVIPEIKSQAWLIRFAIVCPALILGFLLTFSTFFKRFMSSLLALCVLVAAFGVIAMIAMADTFGGSLYYVGVIICVMFSYTFITQSFLLATLTSWTIFVAYEIVVIIATPMSVPVLLNNTFFFLSVNVVGMFANYSVQFYIRKGFLQKHIIEERTKELQDKNEDLLKKNIELVESREELLRSAKRTDMIFAALSEALPGTVLDDKYQLEEKIGSGGFGTVYRATHLLLQHGVAVKVFRPSMGSDPVKNLERFRVEGISASRVRHPNAVAVLDFGVSASSIAYMVMELLEGCSLKDKLDEREALSVARCIDILVPVCSALAEAHAMGIIHRDIKPSNIFLHHTKEGEIVKVVDFGIAKLVSDTLNPEFLSLTETGALLGTPVYMSPERLSNKPYDGHADIYSLGVMIYEMLCGCLPFQSSTENYWSVVLMHLTHTPTLPRRINPEIPEKLEAVVMRSLAKNPQERPTAKELEQSLKEFASTGDLQASTRSSGASQ
jgi:hypothetical protein